jgi:hypothetical protein
MHCFSNEPAPNSSSSSGGGNSNSNSSSGGGCNPDFYVDLIIPEQDISTCLQRLTSSGVMAIGENDPVLIADMSSRGMQQRKPLLNPAQRRSEVARLLTEGTGMTEVLDAMGQPSRLIFAGTQQQHIAAMDQLLSAHWLRRQPGMEDAGKLYSATGTTPNAIFALRHPFNDE